MIMWCRVLYVFGLSACACVCVRTYVRASACACVKDADSPTAVQFISENVQRVLTFVFVNDDV